MGTCDDYYGVYVFTHVIYTFFVSKNGEKLWNIRVVIAKYLSQNCEYVSFNVFISHDCTFFLGFVVVFVFEATMA